jgi:hypothetical protein
MLQKNDCKKNQVVLRKEGQYIMEAFFVAVCETGGLFAKPS